MTKPHDTPGSDERPIEAPARKAYQKPNLQIYGDLADITKTINAMMTNDGSGHQNKHFTS